MASEDLFEDEMLETVPDFDNEVEEVSEEVELVESNEKDAENGSASPHSEKQFKEKPEKSIEQKLIRLPVARIRTIMKVDPDLHIASNEAVFLVTRATELFIGSLARESYSCTAQTKKKTIQKKDVENAIENVDILQFLNGSMF